MGKSQITKRRGTNLDCGIKFYIFFSEQEMGLENTSAKQVISEERNFQK